MKTKFFAVLIAQILFSQIVFGQEERGVTIQVKQNNGRRQAEVLYRNSYALLIGNSEYAEWSNLPGVERDIPQVEAVLRDKHGFTVERALNLSKNELRNRIDQFISKYGQDYENRLLIYYAGHGYTAVLPDKRVMGYLVMKDAPIVSSVEEALIKTPSNLGTFRLNAISMDEIENLAKEIATRHALFVFDSCFSGTALYRDNFNEIPPEVSPEEIEQMRGFLTAGNEKQRVRDDSPFRRAFIKGLEGKADSNGDGVIFGSELGAFVKREVWLETRNTAMPQSPIFGKQTNFTRGDMIFISTKTAVFNTTVNKSAASVSSSGSIIDIKSGEAEYWEEVEKINTISFYERYLAEYPSGEHSATARLRLGKLKWEKNKPLAKALLAYYFGDYFYENLAAVRVGLKSGFIDRNGKEVIAPDKYYKVAPFSEGYASFQLESKGRITFQGRYGFINRYGKEIVPPIYEEVKMFSEGVAAVKILDKWGFVNFLGNTPVPIIYDSAESFSNGLAKVSLNGKSGFVNALGQEIIPLKYSSSLSFSEGLAVVVLDFKKFFIDTTGKEVLAISFDNVKSFSEGLAAVQLNNNWGFIDKSGKLIIQNKYEDATSFSNGIAAVKIYGKWSLINAKGEMLILPAYDEIILEENGKTGILEHSLFGWQIKVGEPLSLPKNLVKVKKTGKIGFLDTTGKILIPTKYDGIWSTTLSEEGFVGIYLNGKKGFVDIYGNEYFDF